jgi:formyltetrahydrofolate-dependent phosphoribosylglycinamide formyltransferase
MFQKLQQKWHVNGWNLLLILCTFALGGSLCGYAGRKILLFTGLEKGVLWVVAYIVLVTLLWPMCVLLISIPLGQFRFFKGYIAKIAAKMSGRKGKKNNSPINMAIFASGAGSNAAKIISAAGVYNYNVSLVVYNKPGAGVIDIAKNAGIPALFIEKERFFHGDHYLPELKKHQVEFIVLAGFLWKMPTAIVNAFPKKIINIHPALLPKYGGRGMYGNHVHAAVIAAGEKQSGISIHYVDEVYDNGEIIFQASCPVHENDTAESLAQRIHALEHEHYPKVLGGLIKK